SSHGCRPAASLAVFHGAEVLLYDLAGTARDGASTAAGAARTAEDVATGAAEATASS
ncbi:hypothetical protein THAOC_20683, partial [Thalassiosira oceanica]